MAMSANPVVLEFRRYNAPLLGRNTPTVSRPRATGGVAVLVGVLVAVAVAVEVGVLLGVLDAVGLTVAVAVAVDVDVAVSVGVDVFEGVAVGVSVGVSVGVGIATSTVQVWIAGVGSLLPAVSVAVTWNVCEPLTRLLKVWGEPQSSISSPSMKQMYETASPDENVKVAESLFTMPEGPESMVVSGAVLSTVTTLALEVVELNPKSTARAVKLTGPSPTIFEFQIVL